MKEDGIGAIRPTRSLRLGGGALFEKSGDARCEGRVPRKS